MTFISPERQFNTHCLPHCPLTGVTRINGNNIESLVACVSWVSNRATGNSHLESEFPVALVSNRVELSKLDGNASCVIP